MEGEKGRQRKSCRTGKAFDDERRIIIRTKQVEVEVEAEKAEREKRAVAEDPKLHERFN
ncbi:hypothetical protein RUM43_008754, partial [Polyplax serrata]